MFVSCSFVGVKKNLRGKFVGMDLFFLFVGRIIVVF